MRNIKCRYCIEYRKDWCHKVKDDPDPDIVRDCQYYRKKTNADHIRNMTDEELAAILDAFCETSECRTADGAVCPFYSACPHDENIGCNGTCGIWTDWLKQPYKEEI